MPSWGIALCAALFVALYIVLSRRRHARRLARRVRAAFGGTPKPRLSADELADVAEYYALRQAHDPRAGVDGITWNDLDMDALFERLNGTFSGVGEEVLYALLHDTAAPDETLALRERYIRALGEREDARAAAGAALCRLGKNRWHGAPQYLFAPKAVRLPLGRLYVVMGLLPLPLLLLGIFAHPAAFALFGLSFLCNAVVAYRTQYACGAQITAVRQLSALCQCARRLARVLCEELSPALERLRALCGELAPVRVWGSLFAMERAGDFDFLTDYFKIMFLLDPVSLTRLTGFLAAHGAAVRELYALVGELDVCLSVASLRASGVDWCVPEFHGERAVDARDIAHPLLKAPVTNSLRWDRSALITGSNASGKSTFVKAMAVNAILAQTLHTCFAARFALPRAQVLTSMAVRDNVRAGDSYFVAEIKSLRRILPALSPERATLCMIDEILRGTNTVERIAASAAFLRYLSGQNILCMAATHDIELTELLSGHYANYHFREELEEGAMRFSYRLMEGPATTRNAIALLHAMGFPQTVTDGAEALAARFDETRAWK